MKNQLKYILGIVCLVNLAYAQTDKDKLNTEITVVKPYTPSVSDAVKLSFKPAEIDTSTAKLDLTYRINPKPYQTTYELSPIPAARIARADLDKLYKNFARFGLGTSGNAFAELFVNSERTRDWVYGIHLKHDNGKLNDETYGKPKFANQQVDVFAKKFYAKYNWKNSAIANWNHFRFYQSYPGSPGLLLESDYKQQLFNFGFKSELNANKSPYQQTLSGLSIGYNHFRNADNIEENNLRLAGTLSRPIEDEFFVLDVVLNYLNGKSEFDERANFDFSFQPKIIAEQGKFNFSLGVRTHVNSDAFGDTRFLFYPDVDIKYNLLSDVFVLYGGLGGGLNMNTAKESFDLFPYLASTKVPAYLRDKKIEITGGLKGALSSRSNYNLGVEISKTEGLPVLDGPGPSVDDGNAPIVAAYTLSYDTVSLFRSFAELHLENGKNLSLTGVAYFDTYKYSAHVSGWELPRIHGSLGVDYALKSKLIFSSTLFFREQVDYRPGNNPAPLDYVNNKTGLIDLNLGAEYRYNNALSAFVKFSNVLGNNYQLVYGYPVQGFNVLGGFSYKF